MASDFITDTDAPTVIIFEDGTEAILPILTNDDIKVICSKVRSQRLAALKESVDEMKIPADQAVYMLFKEKAAPVDVRSAFSHISTIEGSDDVIDLSAKRGKLTDDVIKKIKALSTVTRVAISIETSGIVDRERLFVRKTEEKKAETPPNGSDTNTAAPVTQ